MNTYGRLLVTYLKPQWKRVALLGVVIFAMIALQLINPQVMRQFIDTAKSGGDVRTMGYIALLFIGLAISTTILSVNATFLSEDIGWTATNHLRSDLVLHCLTLDATFHNKRTPGELIERIDGDVTVLGNFFSQFVLRIVGNALLLLGVLVMSFREDWRVGLALGLLAALTYFVLHSLRKISIPLWENSRQNSAELFGFLGERLEATEDIRSSGATLFAMNGLYSRMRRGFLTLRRARLMGSATFVAFGALMLLGDVVSIALAAYLYGLHLITFGTIYLLHQYSTLVFSPLDDIRLQIQDFQRAAASINRILEIQVIRSKIQDGPGTPIPSGPLSVEFRDVTFGYNESEPILKNLSFHLRPGTVLGLLGRTGSGKSSLTCLLNRIYDANEGNVVVGGVETRACRVADVRRGIGVVTQDVQLIQGTVRDNLTFFDKSIADEQILAALQELGMMEWLKRLPQGLDTPLGSSGGGLSAGEGQLLALARMFLRDPGLIILDEASSRLDVVTEQLLERVIDKLLANRTAIIIAHRLSTVYRADEIMILEDGRIREHGPRQQLMNDPNSRFAQLLRTGMPEVVA